MKDKVLSFPLALPILLGIILASFPAQATTYTVKAGGGASFTTIQSCANTATAGDTCTIFSGSYSGWTQSNDGSSGNPITFDVNPGDTVTITSGVTISSRKYVTITGFTFSSGAGITGNGSTQHCIVDKNTMAGTYVFKIPDGVGNNGSDNVFSNNTVNMNTTSSTAPAVYAFGDRNRFENNEIMNGSGDCFELGGVNVVVRGNYCHNLSGSSSGEHIDFVQVMGGGTSPTLSFSLIEGNHEDTCVNQCHFVIIRTGSGPIADGNIIRFNYVHAIDSSGANFGGVGDSVPNNWFYNNTVAMEHQASENGDGASWQNAANGVSLNNIYYKSEANSWSPIIGNVRGDGDIAFNPGYSGSWNATYSSEATYDSLRNQDPQFANYPSDASLQAGSPALGAGVELTTAFGSGSNSKSITVADSHGFQSGWAGAQADWIRIGSSTTVQIASINHSTNVITLASSANWSAGDPIYLYKDSSGNSVLNGARPDIGASGVPGGQDKPEPPTNLQAVIN